MSVAQQRSIAQRRFRRCDDASVIQLVSISLRLCRYRAISLFLLACCVGRRVYPAAGVAPQSSPGLHQVRSRTSTYNAHCTVTRRITPPVRQLLVSEGVCTRERTRGWV